MHGYYTHTWVAKEEEVSKFSLTSEKKMPQDRKSIKLRRTEKDVSITIHGDWRKDWLLWMRQEERILADGLIIFWSEQGYEFSLKITQHTHSLKHLIVNGLPTFFLGFGLRHAFNKIIVIKVLINHRSKNMKLP